MEVHFILGGLLRSRYEYKYNHLQRSTEYRYNLPRIIYYLDLNTCESCENKAMFEQTLIILLVDKHEFLYIKNKL